MSIASFGIEKEFLKDLLSQVSSGEAQLPEFQRGWVWPVENIVGLLASVSLGYPVGTVMMMKTGGEVRFKQRPVEGAEASSSVTAERLILDGQQRLTSLFQALLRTSPLATQDARKRQLEGWFYIDIEQALDSGGDREEAFVFLPVDRKIRNFRNEVERDYSTPESEFEAGLFPVHRVFDWVAWSMDFQKHWGYDRKKILRWNAFYGQVLHPIDKYQLPVIELGKDTPREAVCQVFEKVNTGGVTLTVFELLTATFAADEFDLRSDWELRRKAWAGQAYKVLHGVSNTDFLQAVTLLATQARRKEYLRVNPDDERAPRVGCRRKDMLALSLPEYRTWAPRIVDGLQEAAKFLHHQCIFDVRFLPYGTQLIPLSALLAMLGADAQPQAAGQRLARWYWCGVFGELYSGTTETRISRDVTDVPGWVRGGVEEPRTVQEAQFAANRLTTLRTRNSAAYKGIYAMLLREGARDWRTGESVGVNTYFDDAIDIHHVFPRAWCDEVGIAPDVYNAILNKTPLTARTNRVIGGQAPSVYLPKVASSAKIDDNTLANNVGSHLIDEQLLRRDDFEAFLAARQRELLTQVGAYMGKALTTAASVRIVDDELDLDEDNDL